MRLRITCIGNETALDYALCELTKYLSAMDETLLIDRQNCKTYDEYKTQPTECLLLGVGIGCEKSQDDAVRIDVRSGVGVISGANPRSVLFAVYKFLYALGCRFPTPEPDGDYVPKRIFTPESFDIKLDEKAAYRHRGFCVEGSVDYSHCHNIINWLPKIGMNEFFIQYFHPFQFFNRIYSRRGEMLSVTEVLRMCEALTSEVKRRGLLYHAVGHGWQCEPFGIDGGTYGQNSFVPEQTRRYLALRGGVRELNENNAVATNLCYTDPFVRKTMVSAAVDYCIGHPYVDYLHFWLGDGDNAFCECDRCKALRASDIYLSLLNELDEALTDAGIKTKVVFLAYSDTIWEPVSEHIKNPDRFVFMSCLAHSYAKPLTTREKPPELTEYSLNHNTQPRCFEDSEARLKLWQENFPGDSFLFDYHQIWDHYKDPGYMSCAQRLCGDVKLIGELKLNGLMSCQVTRAGFPSWLPTYAMGRTLWDKSSDFDALADEYFISVYGGTAKRAKEWLTYLSDNFDIDYIRGLKSTTDCQTAGRYKALTEYIASKLPELLSLSENDKAWRKLYLHAETAEIFARALYFRACGDNDGEEREYEKLKAKVIIIENELYSSFDPVIYSDVVRMTLDL